jgi:hypothetical protein
MNRIATTNHDADELAEAEQHVIQSRQKLSRSLHQAGKSSKAMVQRLGQELKPSLAAAAAVAGAALVVGVTVALVRRSKRRQGWLAPQQQPSALATAAKGAGLWALRYVARRAAQELVTRLREPKVEPSSHPAQ